MYERFTDGTRKTLQAANSIAQKMNHEYIGTEHLILALLEDRGNGFNILRSWCGDNNKTLHSIAVEVKSAIQSGPDMVTMGKLPHTPRAKKVIEYAIEEARKHGNNYVGTEHLLLGLIREGDGVAGIVLSRNGLTYSIVDEYLVFEVFGAAKEAFNAVKEEKPVLAKKPDVDRARILIQEVIKAVQDGCPQATIVFLAKEALVSLE